MADTTKRLSTSLAEFYSQRASEKRYERELEEQQREYERAMAEQTAAQEAAQAAAQREQNQGGFLGGIGYSLEKVGLGFLSGIEGIWDYAAGGLAKLFGADNWAEQQIANDWVNYNHADEWFNPSEGWHVVGDVAGGIGTSLPSIVGVAAGAAIAYFSGGTLTPVAASLIAGSIAGLGAAGRATKEAYDQTGELTGKEFGYGALVGVTEGTIEGVSSALGAGTGAVVKSISKSFGKEVAKSATRNTLLKGVVKGFAGEAFEEGVSAILEPVYKRMTYDPNAKNATFQEVAYAALIGGLSGAIMGGGDVAVRNIRGTARGNTLVNEGKAGDVITTAEQISSYQTENQTDYETFQVVQNTLDELKTSLQKTGGEVRTVRQKMLLGVLEQANTSAAFEPIVTASAENIYNNAEAVAARLNELGYKDQNGKQIQITAEQIREGIDTTDAASFRKTMAKALKTNSALRTLAVADTVGQISMDTARFRDAALSEQSSKLITQADLNRFVEQATDAERQAVADRLGIDNWETLTNEQFHDKITEFVANGGVQEYQQEQGYVKEAQTIAPESARKHLPRMVNLRNDGTYRYTQGGTDIAITKRGDSYYVYDYESGLMSKALTRSETNRVLREIHTNEQNYQNGVRQHTEAQNRLREQATEIDAYARENISEYKNLSAAGQAAIRATIRQGRAAGVQEDFVLSCARVSARSGLRVVFSKEASFVAANGSYADGAIDLKNNRIIINPEAKSRSGESILIHELTHAIYNDTDGSLTVAEGLETMTDAEKEKIRKRYAAVGQGSALEVSDEINAHFAEQTLSNKNILERLVQKKQTLKDKILGFFRNARTDYKSDERLTGAAARLYRQYKKLFDEFSARNQRYLGTENASEQARKYVGNKHFALKTYSEKQKENWKNSKNIVIYESSEQLQEFVRQSRSDNQYSKKMYFGAIGSELAARIEEQTGLNLENYNYALRSDEVRKIFKDHGTLATEAPRGQRPVTEADFLVIPDILDGATSITLSEKEYNGQPAIVFSNVSGNERTTVVAVVSGKHLDLRVQTEYIGKKNGTLATLSGEQAPNNTPKASRGTDSTNSIVETAEKVNRKSGKGKKFALAGEASETADLSLLDRAKQLQAAGEDSETIRRETGWFVGYDNQWRYEIDDSAATLVEKPAFENHSTEDGGYRTAKLGDIMHHEELYAAYPFLKDVTVILQETETGVDGSAFAEDGQIVLDQRLFTRTSKEYQKYLENRQPEIKRIEQTPEYQEYNRFYTDESLQETLSAEEWLAQEEAARNKFFASELGKKYHELMWGKPNVATTELGWSDKAKSVLMHEVQHLIQAHEGFASGASDTYWYNRLLKQYRGEAAVAREKFLKLRIEAAPELQQAMYDMEDTLNRLDVSESSIARAYDNAAKYAKNDSQRDILWDYTQAYSKLSDFYKNGRRYADDRYTNTAGEIEARDVSSRLNMTAEERRQNRPDIDRKRVYFSDDTDGNASSTILPETDSNGRKLSKQQREFFRDSKVVDGNGRLLSVYHGTKDGGFTVFQYDKTRQTGDDFGKAYYFTTNLKNAKGYAKDNRKDPRVKQYQERRDELSKQIVAAAERGESVETIRELESEFRNVRVDGKTLLEILYDTDYDTGGTVLNVYLNLRNPLIVDAGGEVYYRVYPRYFEQARSNNNDGIIIKNVDDSSVYGVGISDVYIAFDENQIKLTSNKAPTADNDMRYALAESDSDGSTLSNEQREYFKNSKVTDENGRLRVTYHGSPNSFYTFDRSRIGKGNDQFGAGFYFATNEEASRHYGDNIYKTYLNITKPIVIDRTTDGGDLFDVKITQKQAYEILKRHPFIYDPEESPLGDMFEEYWEVGAKDYMIREAAKNLSTIGLLDSDYMAFRNYPNELHEALRDIIGYDGVEVRFESGDRFYVAWFENQIKLTSNETPTADSDIRFALPDTDSTGASLSQEQRAFFKDSKVVDGKGRLLKVYHGTPNGNFTVFNTSSGAYFTENEAYARRYMQAHSSPTAQLIEAYLNIVKPFDTRQEAERRIFEREFYRKWGNGTPLSDVGLPDWTDADDLIDFINENGYDYDGLILDEGGDGGYGEAVTRRGVSYVAFLPEQIKLTANKKPTGGSDVRFALSDSVVNVNGETASWTSERVTDLIDRYGATNPRYTQAYATWINPADFVKATTVNQTRRNQIYDEAGNLDIDALSRETQTPYLTVDYETMRVVGHEGRHRMAALAKAGVKRVAVAVRFTEDSLNRYDAHIMEGEHKLKGQSFSSWDTEAQRVKTRTSHNSASVGALVPINAAYSAQLSEFTSERGVRFALDSSEDGNTQPRGNYSVGQRARFAANNTGMRVYTKAEAEEVINSIIEERLVFEDIGMYGELRGKDRQAVVDYLFQKLNAVKAGYRGGVALRIADYMIERTVLTDMYADSNGEVSEAMRTLSVLRGYMHKIDLKHIQDEIQYRYDRKNSINLVWGAKEGGIAPDTLPQLLADEGIYLDAINEADCFLQMVEMYEEAKATVNNATEKVMLTTYGDARTIKKLRQQIARDILNAYEQKGRKSKYAKLVEKYTKQIAELKSRLSEANANNRLINSIVDQAQKMRDLKLGTFLNSTQYKSDVFKSSIEALGKIKYRGNFNIAGTRKIMANLRTWYTKENPLLTESYEQGIADMLDEVANGTKGYSKAELQTIQKLMAYFTNFVEKFNKVYRQGRWVDAASEATRYIDSIHKNDQLKVGLFRKIAGSTYMQTFGDPMAVARRMDMYESGFYTEMLTELREAAIDSEITEMEVRQSYDEFLKKNKKFLSQAAKQTIEYRGVKVPKMHLISLYMTLKRAHAQAGLAQNGFAFTDADGKRVRADGFAPDITEDSELRAAAMEEQAAIANLLTETDREYIAILEKAFNEDAKKLKADRDMQRLGFTNATEDYYYPIRRGNIAKNVDSSDIQGELDRVSNASFNKDTVRGAKQELYIESADAVFNRHIHAVVKYATLSPAIETYNKLYNLDIGGNPNKPISVATESANTWAKGNKYFSKLISDIQGIPSSSSEGMRALSFIRGSYARFQLGANPKVWVTQLSSLFAASSVLDASSISRGMFVSAKDVDIYCPLAKLRAQDNTAAMAQGVLDKVGKVSNALMAPIGKMDRFVIRRLFGACQVQVQKNGGAKVGTEANKVEAGKLLKRVILETQQNSLATERSAAMRSGNEIMRTLTMFSADSMKVIGRVIDSVGELSTLRAKLRAETDTTRQAALRTQIKAARKKVFKSITALATSALFMAAVAQLFNWLYNKDRDDDETAAEQVLVDFTGNLLGGLPLIRDFYSRLVEGYSIDNYAYSALNDMLDSAVNLFDSVAGAVTGEESNTKMAARIKNLIYSIGQLTGIPTRNLYNVFYGLAKRISPTTAYKIDEAFYTKNHVTDLDKAIESDDTDMIAMLTSMIFGERMGNTTMSDAVRNKFVDLYSKGYSVLPRSIGDTITYGGVEIPLTDQEYNRFRAIYAQSMKDLEKMMSSGTFNALSDEMQSKAIKQVYDAYYYDALSDLVGVDERTTVGELSEWIDMSRLSVAFAGLSDVESDKNSKGETIAGSKKKNTVKYLLGQNLSDGERLLILAYRGYSIQDGDYKGYTAKRAKRILLQYILKLNVTQAEKAALAEKCGFTVRNGRIIRDF